MKRTNTIASDLRSVDGSRGFLRAQVMPKRAKTSETVPRTHAVDLQYTCRRLDASYEAFFFLLPISTMLMLTWNRRPSVPWILPWP